jgi:hypothetical protein
MVKVIRSPKALAAALAFSLDNTGCRAAIKGRLREAIVAALNAQLKKGDKALIGNSAYRRYLRKSKEAEGSQVFQIEAGKLAEEAWFDGIFVLRPTPKSRRCRRSCAIAISCRSRTCSFGPSR